jgi:hypothetical protein
MPPPLTEGYTPPPPLTEGYMPPPPLQRQQYSQSNKEEPYYMTQTNNSYIFYVPDKYDPDHFMPWVHPFTSVISGPTGSGKSVFVRRFVHNIRHMMTPKPDRILWCYGEYKTLYGTVDGVDFQQGLPDLDTLDPREKHLIILDDLIYEMDQRVASLFTEKNHHRNISVMYIVQNMFHQEKHHRTISLNAHYMVLFKRIADHGASTPNVSQENAIFPGIICPSYDQTSRLHGDRYETKHAGYPEIGNLHLSRSGIESVCRVIKRMLHPVSCHSFIRC